jgi:hypothetical protein
LRYFLLAALGEWPAEEARCFVKGHNHGRWKGGTYLNGDGYLKISAGPLRGQYVHRLVLEAKLGRALAEDEEAHHINGDRLDPRPENLEAVKVDEHRAFLNGHPAWRGKP